MRWLADTVYQTRKETSRTVSIASKNRCSRPLMMILDRLTNVKHPLDFFACLEFCQESANLRENGTKRSFLISPSNCSNPS